MPRIYQLSNSSRTLNPLEERTDHANQRFRCRKFAAVAFGPYEPGQDQDSRRREPVLNDRGRADQALALKELKAIGLPAVLMMELAPRRLLG